MGSLVVHGNNLLYCGTYWNMWGLRSSPMSHEQIQPIKLSMWATNQRTIWALRREEEKNFLSRTCLQTSILRENSLKNQRNNDEKADKTRMKCCCAAKVIIHIIWSSFCLNFVVFDTPKRQYRIYEGAQMSSLWRLWTIFSSKISTFYFVFIDYKA